MACWDREGCKGGPSRLCTIRPLAAAVGPTTVGDCTKACTATRRRPHIALKCGYVTCERQSFMIFESMLYDWIGVRLFVAIGVVLLTLLERRK